MKKISLVVLVAFFAVTIVVMFQNCAENAGSAQLSSYSTQKEVNWDKYDPYLLPLLW